MTDQNEEDRYLVIDMETSIKNRGEESVGNFKASPYHPDNNVVMYGQKWSCSNNVVLFNSVIPDITLLKPDLLVGHNIGFDLLYALKSKRSWDEWLKTGYIWDTMLAQYLITGQQEKFAPLDSCSIKYGGTVKDDRIKEYWENDVDTEDIPKEELEEYLKQDVLNTEIVFLAQVEIAEKMGLFPLIRTQMEARLATIEMEWNGMHMDKQCLEDQFKCLDIDAARLQLDLLLEMHKVSKHFDNPTSSKQVGTYLFGGELKYQETIDILDEDGKEVRYKSGIKKGEVKRKTVVRTEEIPALLDGTKWSSRGANSWSVSEAVLKKIRESAIGISSLFAEALLKSRKLEKDINTYYKGYSKLLWHDGKLHPSYNHCSTSTGRLSCSNPNLQQASGG